MYISPVFAEDRQLITSYGNSQFVIGGCQYEHSVFVSEAGVKPWAVSVTGDILQYDAIAELLASADTAIDILLLGVGGNFNCDPQKIATLYNDIRREHNIGLEVMDTGAACRSFNILYAESRNVAAALTLV